MHNITPCLWFDKQAEEAANFYVGIFRDSRILEMTRYGEGLPLPKGTVMTVKFEVNGREFVALNGGPYFQFTPAVSFVVDCETQEEVDHYWSRLSDGGSEGRCGWLTDRFGVSWQVVPTILPGLLTGKDEAGAQRATAAMLQMTKLDIASLKQAYDRGN